MRNRLILYLQANKLTVEPVWLVDGVPHHGEVDLLSEQARDREVIVLVPAEDVLLTSVKLPKMSRTRLMQALPFALEEQLITDVEELHFAVGNLQQDGSIPVAVVSNNKMNDWLAWLATWQIKAYAILPITLALPEVHDTWQGIVDTQVIVRTGMYSGFACDAMNCHEYFKAAVTEAIQTPSELLLRNYSKNAYGESLSVVIPVREEFHEATELLANLASYLPENVSLNLLQQDYAPKLSHFPQLKLGWKIAGYLAFSWIFILLLYPSVSSLILGYQVRSINQDISQIYKRHFPHATSIVAPKQRLQEKLRTLASEESQSESLLMLGHLAKGMTKVANIHLKRVDYQHHQMTVELTALTPEALSAFTNVLAESGLDVRQQNADLNAGSRVTATLVIRQ